MSQLLWGPYTLARRFGPRHFLASGATGSGKTTLIDALVRTVFGGEAGATSRALFYDPKQDVLSKLEGLGLMSRVKVLHPFDDRASAWDMAKDVTDALAAQQLAQILVPEGSRASREDSFFDAACRDLISGVVQVFAFCVPARDWTFRDLLLALLYPKNLELVLSQRTTTKNRPFPLPERLWDAYVSPETTDERTRGNIRASLNARLAPYESVAAAWERAGARRFSLAEWAKDGSNQILVLGNEEGARAAIDPINRAIFARAAELVLARKELPQADVESGRNQSWFFLDELRGAGELPSLNPLLIKGRSKGACVVLSFQDIDGLRSVYGKERTNEIVANCNTIALLKTNSAATAEWAAQMFGRFLVEETDVTEGMSAGTPSASESTKLAERSAVYPGEFLYLPLPSAENHFVGYFRDADASAEDPSYRELDWEAFSALRLPNDVDKDYEPLDKEDLFLTPWTEEEVAARLRFDRSTDPGNLKGREARENGPKADEDISRPHWEQNP